LKILIIAGTRPEIIKLISLLIEINRRGLKKNFVFIHTGQHDVLAEQLFSDTGISPDLKYNLSFHDVSLVSSFRDILGFINDYIKNNSDIKCIISQGDTTSCCASAFASFTNKIPFIHIEAGLRTYDLQNPFPEEYYRKIISLSASMHFAPTVMAYNNLIKEGIDENKILITGNTVVDAIELFQSKNKHIIIEALKNDFGDLAKNIVLITCHRRENQNVNFDNIIDCVKRLSGDYQSYLFLWISHPNPFIEENLVVESFKEFRNIKIIEPLNYSEMLEIYEYTRIIITDSGGIQEEAACFKIPVVVIRKMTERMESVEAGISILSSCNYCEIALAFDKMLKRNMAITQNPYGEGKAALKILDYLERNYIIM
jgi:UDP-N-acetylglucosamine 2-epimerase (non-hydrolysing)